MNTTTYLLLFAVATAGDERANKLALRKGTLLLDATTTLWRRPPVKRGTLILNSIVLIIVFRAIVGWDKSLYKKESTHGYALASTDDGCDLEPTHPRALGSPPIAANNNKKRYYEKRANRQCSSWSKNIRPSERSEGSIEPTKRDSSGVESISRSSRERQPSR